MRYLAQLPIWRSANRLLLEIEQGVRGFSRYHKYTIGHHLRETAMRICQALHRAFSRRNSQIKMVQQVAELIDDIKMQIQLAKELHAFHSFRLRPMPTIVTTRDKIVWNNFGHKVPAGARAGLPENKRQLQQW
ncbi:hypothetical protein [Vibrio cholerae]|uniref:hypothetical protein n=1 Tax=Vibrio cholerae TaxID=666 RepID=UPI0022AFEE8D|nr:hypothetical protein [Vibrio cholerae]